MNEKAALLRTPAIALYCPECKAKVRFTHKEGEEEGVPQEFFASDVNAILICRSCACVSALQNGKLRALAYKEIIEFPYRIVMDILRIKAMIIEAEAKRQVEMQKARQNAPAPGSMQ